MTEPAGRFIPRGDVYVPQRDDPYYIAERYRARSADPLNDERSARRLVDRYRERIAELEREIEQLRSRIVYLPTGFVVTGAKDLRATSTWYEGPDGIFAEPPTMEPIERPSRRRRIWRRTREGAAALSFVGVLVLGLLVLGWFAR